MTDVHHIPLRARDGSVRAYAIIDAEDFERLNRRRWSLHPNGCAHRGGTRNYKQYKVMMHREVLGLPETRGTFEVDRINRNRLDNRKANLRVVTRLQQMQNIPPRRGTASRYRGVTFYRPSQRWRGRVHVAGREVWQAYFKDEHEAGRATQEARRRYMSHAVD